MMVVKVVSCSMQVVLNRFVVCVSEAGDMEATLRFCISSLIAKAALIFFSYELGQGDKTSSRKRPHDFTFSWMTSGGEKKKGFDVVHVEVVLCCVVLCKFYCQGNE